MPWSYHRLVSFSIEKLSVIKQPSTTYWRWKAVEWDKFAYDVEVSWQLLTYSTTFNTDTFVGIFLSVLETHSDLYAPLVELWRKLRECPFFDSELTKVKQKKHQLKLLCRKRSVPSLQDAYKNFWKNSAMQTNRKRRSSINPKSLLFTDPQAKRFKDIWKNSSKVALLNYVITQTQNYLPKVSTLFSRKRIRKLSLKWSRKGASKAKMSII